MRPPFAAARPDVKIAGPAEWGWTGYFYSAKDKKAGFHAEARSPRTRRRAAHPVVARARSCRVRASTGIKLLDVLDLHFYPQARTSTRPRLTRKTAALRIDQVRGLWDPTYVDESWIGSRCSSSRACGRGSTRSTRASASRSASGASAREKHMSGGLATAEALGRFGAVRGDRGATTGRFHPRARPRPPRSMRTVGSRSTRYPRPPHRSLPSSRRATKREVTSCSSRSTSHRMQQSRAMSTWRRAGPRLTSPRRRTRARRSRWSLRPSRAAA